MGDWKKVIKKEKVRQERKRAEEDRQIQHIQEKIQKIMQKLPKLNFSKICENVNLYSEAKNFHTAFKDVSSYCESSISRTRYPTGGAPYVTYHDIAPKFSISRSNTEMGYWFYDDNDRYKWKIYLYTFYSGSINELPKTEDLPENFYDSISISYEFEHCRNIDKGIFRPKYEWKTITKILRKHYKDYSLINLSDDAFIDRITSDVIDIIEIFLNSSN